jgi:hypothetical protein
MSTSLASGGATGLLRGDGSVDSMSFLDKAKDALDSLDGKDDDIK